MLLALLLAALFIRMLALSAQLRLVRPLTPDAFAGRVADGIRSLAPAWCAEIAGAGHGYGADAAHKLGAPALEADDDERSHTGERHKKDDGRLH